VAVASHLHPVGSFALADHPQPTGREENWRFTPLERLHELLAGPLAAPETVYDLAVEASGAVVKPDLAVGQKPRGTVLIPVDRAAALASQAERATYLRWSDGQVLTEPVRITVTGRGQAQTAPAAAHLVIELGAQAEATVVVDHQGQANFLGNVELRLGPGAHLTLVSLQRWSAGSFHLGQHEAVIGRDARLRHIVVSLGGDLVRLQTNVSYADQGGEAELLGLYVAQSGQHLEHRLFVDHNRPRGVSRVDYRGALHGQGAHSVWVGDVLIRPQAEGIETYESNRNLLLTEGGQADAVPNLEIETGEIVGAGHSAATGRFDEEQLFYLRSRGLPEAEARRLVLRGFFAQLIHQIGLADVEALLSATIDEELALASASDQSTENVVPASADASQPVKES
jgi:Fe-S cluster assembly protein SufD